MTTEKTDKFPRDELLDMGDFTLLKSEGEMAIFRNRMAGFPDNFLIRKLKGGETWETVKCEHDHEDAMRCYREMGGK